MREWWQSYHSDMGKPSAIEMIGGVVLIAAALSAAWMTICVILACGQGPVR